MMKKHDYIFIVAVMVFCLAALFLQGGGKSGGDSVCIYVNSKPYKKLPVSVDAKVNIDDKNTVVIKDGYAYMEYASCPDKLCIRQGKIHNSNWMIVCLPNKVTVKIEKLSDTYVTSK